MERPWIKGGVRIKKAVIERVDQEAIAGYAKDEESCGLLTGPASDGLLVDTIVPMVNRAKKLHELDPETYPRTARMYFDLDPLKFQRAIESGDAEGKPVKVLYHSHLDVGAYFSETDAAAAKMGGDAPAYALAYLVTSVKKVDGSAEGGTSQTTARVDDRKLFVWDEATKAFVEAELRVVE